MNIHNILNVISKESNDHEGHQQPKKKEVKRRISCLYISLSLSIELALSLSFYCIVLILNNNHSMCVELLIYISGRFLDQSFESFRNSITSHVQNVKMKQLNQKPISNLNIYLFFFSSFTQKKETINTIKYKLIECVQ